MKNSPSVELLTLSSLEERMHFTWQSSLQFSSLKIEQKVLKKVSKALRKNQITEREKFLGVNFQEEIAKGIHPNVSIRFIDDIIGYGVFADGDIPSGTFIGEYTGVVRKRVKRLDRSNDYCFAYAIGEWLRNPFIIDAQDTGNITRFINHKEEPNLESISVYANGVIHIILISIKSIAHGTQLTYDYGATYWKKRRNRLFNNL